MIVASILSIIGFVLTAAVTQTKGLRLGGAILVPTLVVYALKDFTTLPVFVLSTAVAYFILWQAKERTLVYGRDEFLVALAGGALVPMIGYFALVTFWPAVLEVNPLVFVGSILPGLAAYNVAQTKPEYRRQDLLYTAGLIVGLVLLGGVLIAPPTARAVGDLTPLILFAETSDVATLRDAVVAGYLAPNIDVRSTIVLFFLVGMALSELVRREFGIRIGIISMALLALFSLVSRWLLVLFLLSFAVSLAAVWLIHLSTLLYGRVLLSLGCGVGSVAALLLALELPIIRGFSALFVGVIAGVMAYAIHTTPPRERRQQPFLAVGTFLGMLLLIRAVVDPFRRGLLQEFTAIHVAVAGLTIVACLAIAYRLRIPKPDDEDVLSASVLSGGEG
ncbi:poly-gamma-glutamate biosynthesis protein PgsC/CapC [Halobellus limi]|uniref:Capsule biosynthesis CapC n=1 Tax=Halobellus limi TaxID=699433 RepID=A0A1H5ZMW1_9EURY|nr:poly-gamma-glutamate biosynthesis protein PgsC/CapC [Halobellus limi]SEG36726.1 Capsule biosynthesis CapC [Halobellus limi]